MLLLLPALLLAGQSATAQHAKPSEPIVQVGLFSYHADGTAAGSAFGTAERLESTVFASGSLCQLGAGYRDLAGDGGARVEVHRPRGQRERRVRGRAAGMATGDEPGLLRVGGPDIRGADAQSR